MAAIPMVNGVPVMAFPPEGWVSDIVNPTRSTVLEHYLIFGIMGSFAFLTMCQRFYVKLYLTKGLSIDDLFITLAWITSVATQAMMCHQVIHKRMGLHAWETIQENFFTGYPVVYATAPVFMMCNGFTKLSLLTFYLPLSPQTWWRICVWASIALVATASTIITIMLFVHCTPPAAAWDLTITKFQCLDVTILYITTAAVNIATDILLFALPVPMILQLRMGWTQKVGALAVFGIGTMTIATSIVRLVLLMDVLQTKDLPWDAAIANVWTLIEANLFIICASMPTLRKFFKHVAPSLMGTDSGGGGSHTAGNNSSFSNALRTIGGSGGPQNTMSRKSRREYERSDDDVEMDLYGGDRSRKVVNHVSVESYEDERGATSDNGSDKDILDKPDKGVVQTKTFNISYGSKSSGPL